MVELGFGGTAWRPLGKYWDQPVASVGQFHYSDESDEAVFRTPCPVGSTNTITRAASLLQCWVCPLGQQCREPGLGPSPCPAEKVCSPNFTIVRSCLPGYREMTSEHVFNYFNCGESTAGAVQTTPGEAENCKPGYVCPRGSVSTA